MRMQRELQVLDNALGQLSTERRLNESERNKGNATLENLKPFADDSVTYKSVGRMCVVVVECLTDFARAC
jgi:chaperonin cofactor prefoldin